MKFRRSRRKTSPKDVRAWWEAHPDLSDAFGEIEFLFMSDEITAGEMRERMAAAVSTSGAELPCGIDEFLSSWIL